MPRWREVATADTTSFATICKRILKCICVNASFSTCIVFGVKRVFDSTIFVDGHAILRAYLARDSQSCHSPSWKVMKEKRLDGAQKKKERVAKHAASTKTIRLSFLPQPKQCDAPQYSSHENRWLPHRSMLLSLELQYIYALCFDVTQIQQIFILC